MSLWFKEIFLLYTNNKYLEQFARVCRSSLLLLLTDSFKNKLDKFWSNQDLLYNYKAELTWIESRSFINNFD